MICEYGCGQEAKYQLGNGKWCCSPKYNSCSNSRKKNSNSLKGKFEGNKNPNYGGKHSKETRKKMSEKAKGRIFSDETKNKIRFHSIGKNNPMYGKKGKDSPRWKGGVTKRNLPLYDTYAHQIEYAEQVRRNKDNPDILEVKCAYCGKWYIPKRSNISSRIEVLNGNSKYGESRLYCSKECKQQCPIFNQTKYPKGYKKASSREVQPELRQLVFERDNWTCKKCGSIKSLHCHHIEGIKWEPLESADIDKCITYCKSCHREVHQLEECGYKDMQCKEK